MGNQYCSLVLHCCTLRLKWTSLALQICELCGCLVFLLPSFFFPFFSSSSHSFSFKFSQVHSFKENSLEIFVLLFPWHVYVFESFSYEHKALWHWQLLPASLLMCRVCVLCCCMFINGNCYQQNIAKSQLSGRIVYSSSHYRREPAVM